MKHLITRIEYITGDIRRIELINLETDDIEKTRREFKELMVCDRVNFTYETKEKY